MMRTTMRVVLVCPYSWTRPGGVQNHVAGLARALRGLGAEAEVLAPADAPTSEGVLAMGRSIGIPSNGSRVPVALSPAAPSRVRRALRAARPDLVHIHEPMIPAVSFTALRSATTPLVGTFHKYADGSGWYRVFGGITRRSLERLDARIAVSDAARRHVSKVAPGDYEVIPNGVDVAAIAGVGADGRGAGRIAFIGRPERRKGLRVLLRAAERLPAGTRVDLIGVSAEQLVALWGGSAPAGVVAHGRVDDAARDRLLAGADVLAVPSLRSESFGIVLLEGMAAGLPVVASKVGGYPDLLPPEAGCLVPPGDVDALAGALRSLLGDAAVRERMGAAGRRHAASYDWSTVAASVVEVYERVLRGRAR